MGLIDSLFRHDRHSLRSPKNVDTPILRLSSLQGIGQRDQQEDSFYISSNIETEQRGFLAIISDGIGGMLNGKEASSLTINCFLRQFWKRGTDVPARFQKAAQKASKRIYQKFSGYSGATLAAVYIIQGELYWVSVGDSAIFLMRNGDLFRLNQEHTFLSTLYRKGLKEAETSCTQTIMYEDAERLTSFIGMAPLQETEGNLSPFPLKTGDVLLLCSDGVSGVLSPPELVEGMNLEPKEGCKLLETLIQGKQVLDQDNYTGIMISYTE